MKTTEAEFPLKIDNKNYTVSVKEQLDERSKGSFFILINRKILNKPENILCFFAVDYFRAIFHRCKTCVAGNLMWLFKVNRFGDSDEDKQKIRSMYGRAEYVTRVAFSRIKKLILKKYHFNEEEFYKLLKICKKSKVGISYFLSLKSRNTDLFNLLFLDFQKYNSSVCKYIIRKSPTNKNKYMGILKNIPSIVKNNYGLSIMDENFVKALNVTPRNRFDYYVISALDYFRKKLHPENSMMPNDFMRRLSKTKISVWHAYKKYKQIQGPYSVKKLYLLFNFMMDGAFIYLSNSNNKYKIQFSRIKGSPMKMLRNSIFNHRQELELRKRERLNRPNKKLFKPGIKLPEWIENIRIKTAHDLILAGLECQHCIGSFVDSPDIFVREGDICAQINRDNLKVIQCYDKKDTVTKESKKLVSRLTSSLEAIKNKKED